jgi:hypothetical protein
MAVYKPAAPVPPACKAALPANPAPSEHIPRTVCGSPLKSLLALPADATGQAQASDLDR